MQFLRSNTAVIVAVGPFYDKTDGVTIENALTATNERITLVAATDAGSAPTLILDNITGAAAATSNDIVVITGGDAGIYQMELAAADVNRVGRMLLSITDAANHVPVFHEFFVLPQAIYDWLTGAIVPLPANMTQILGTATATPATAGVLDINVKNINNVVAATPGATGGVFIAGTNAATTVTTSLTTTFTGNLSGSVGSLATQAKADVNAEVVDALATDTYAEPAQGTPAATTTLAVKLGFLYKAWRNKSTQTATQYSLLNDDAATVDHKATISDDATTAIKGEIATGP
jgi:hypothetical protein